jgi:phage repressor protein C with HTH and peptisase S24 domain
MVEFRERGDRLRWAREQAGYENALDFVRAHDISQSAYYHHESNRRGFSSAVAERYARLLRIDYTWLQTGKGSPTKSATNSIIGFVGTNAEVELFDDENARVFTDYKNWCIKTESRENLEAAPSTPEGSALAEVIKVKGNSNYPAYQNGDLIYLADKTAKTDDMVGMVGRECIIQLADGRKLLRTLSRGSRKGVFTLLSYNSPPIHDVKVAWVAPINWIKRS